MFFDKESGFWVDSTFKAMINRLKASAWDLSDAVIIEGLSRQLIIDFCHAEINNAYQS